ncbi:MAG TPA: 4-hydroxy-tetrahydrodipicolinate synthase [Planctomycetota bacterium]|nr:4-hydroxy-tetrahydrodipicolinate synthase [Planctomycetota bacterium]
MRGDMRFFGCYTALVTPFDADGHVDFPALDAHVEAQIAGGVQGVVPCGTTGESPTLSHEEHREVIRRVIEKVAGRVTVIAGCGSNCTDEALSLTKFAVEVGADATLQVAPYYNKPSQEGLYRHYEAIAKASSRPVVLYNVPGRCGVNLAPATVARLFKIENVTSIKEAAGSVDQVSEILDLCEIDVLSGDDNLTLPMLAVGAIGVISVSSNIVPGDVAAMCRAFRDGALDEARAYHRRMFALVRALFIEGNPTPVKTAMAFLGRGNGIFRLPLVPLEEKNAEKLHAALVTYGLLERR